MISKLHSWWQKSKRPLEIALISIFFVGLFVLIILVILGSIFQWKWTGFGPETSEPKQHAKTLWDWLQLLIIPAVLAVGGYVFNLTTSRNEQKSTQLRDQTERDIASDNQREAALQAYIDNMSELLLDRKLRESKPNDEVRKIARVRTLTVLPHLDATRKSSILQFIYESALLGSNEQILDLTGAQLNNANLNHDNLSGANLSGVVLSGANLYRANLRGVVLNKAFLYRTFLNKAFLSDSILSDAVLSHANLSNTDLSGADLSGADLSGADLSGADLSGAKITTKQLKQAASLKYATMPDGSKHP